MRFCEWVHFGSVAVGPCSDFAVAIGAQEPHAGAMRGTRRMPRASAKLKLDRQGLQRLRWRTKFSANSASGWRSQCLSTAQVISFASTQTHNRLHVKCLREKIEQVKFDGFIASLHQYGEIARERRRLAGNISNPWGLQAAQALGGFRS